MRHASRIATSSAPLFGRILMAALFLISGLLKLATPTPTQGFIASAGLPMPFLAYAVAVVVEVGGAILLLIGYRVRPTAMVLAVYCAVTALVFHFQISDPNQLVHLLKNFAIAGGLLMVFEFGAGSYSLDSRRAAGTHDAVLATFER